MSSRGGPILVVEDDPDIRDALRDALESAGYDVATACHGKEGLDRLHEIERPSLILLDLMMPVMSGPEFLEELKSDDALNDVPVVIVSAYGHLMEPSTGAVGLIKKPVQLDALLDSVERYAH